MDIIRISIGVALGLILADSIAYIINDIFICYFIVRRKDDE